MPIDLPKSEGTGFSAKLKNVAEEIKQEAKGRVCGDCRYCQGMVCSYPWDWKGASLELTIYTPQAVACKRWRARDG